MKREDITKIFEGATDEQISAVLNINSADCNLDTNITISDITILIDYLLGGNW